MGKCNKVVITGWEDVNYWKNWEISKESVKTCHIGRIMLKWGIFCQIS